MFKRLTLISLLVIAFSCEKDKIILDGKRGKASDLTFTTLTKKYQSGVQFTTSEINDAIKGDKKGYTLKTLEMIDDGGTGASVAGTAPNFSVKNMTKEGRIKVKITLSHKTKEEAVIAEGLLVLNKPADVSWVVHLSDANVRHASLDDVVVSNDNNGVVAVGKQSKIGEGQSGLVVKLNKQGRVVWKKVFKHTMASGTREGFFNAITPLKDGSGYMIAGTVRENVGIKTFKNAWIFKIDNDGNKLLDKQVTRPSHVSDFVFLEVITNRAGDYLFNGHYVRNDVSTPPYNTNEIWYKTDADGNRLDFGLTNGFTKDVHSTMNVIENQDGNYVNVGTRKARTGQSKADMTVLGSGLAMLGGISILSFGDWDLNPVFKDIVQLADKSYLVVGRKQTISGASGTHHGWVVSLGSDFSLKWEKTYVRLSQFDAIVPAKGGGFVVGGTKYIAPSYAVRKAWLVKIDKDGNKQWEKLFQKDNNTRNQCHKLVNLDGTYIGVGLTTDATGLVKPFVFSYQP